VTAPGVAFERVDLNRPAVARLRTDVCGFLGYTERGPVDRPVKLDSWRQFLDAFGPPLSFAHTGHAVRLFFDGGGVSCYVMRVADPRVAAPAAVSLAGLTLRAAYSAISRAATEATGPTSGPAAPPADSPGAWGNRLTVTVEQGGLGITRSLPHQPRDGTSLRVETIAGLGAGSWLRLVQDAAVSDFYTRVVSLDPQLREIVLDPPIARPGLDPTCPVLLETVEFTLRVALDGEEVERHADLSLDPGHPRRADLVLAGASTLLSAVLDADPALLSDPARWPVPGLPVRFAGGRDGLATATAGDFLSALAAFEKVAEIAVLAAPDVVLRAVPPETDLGPPLRSNRCTAPEEPPAGRLTGVVLEAGSATPVAGVRVTSRDVEASAALTDAAGRFTLRGLPIGQVALRLQGAGYGALDASAQVFGVAIPAPQRFELAPASLPPALGEDEIFTVCAAMAAQGERGLHRVAILDPPEEMLGVEEIQGWRGRFDTSFAALYWPWLVVAPPGEEARTMPPSGAVAGLIARMDLLEGPQRAAANRPLRHVEALSHPVDDGLHGLLNALGINVVRATPGQGVAPQGARTLSSDADLRYLGVRRLLLMISAAIEEAHQWAVFEPNTSMLRDALTHSLNQFLGALHRQGAFAGDTPEASFAVKCDAENNPPDLAAAGRVLAEIAVAPVRPYEYIRLRLGRTDRLTVQE